MDYEIYKQLKKQYDENDFENLLKNSNSRLFLKIYSIKRKELLADFASKIEIDPNQKAGDLIEQIANDAKTEKCIDEFINRKFQEDRKERKLSEPNLISQLRCLRVFDWGGLYQNSLEKTIVNNYIKKIKNFDALIQKIDNEISDSVRGYVLCSWYNHWTSILIEDIFKEHNRVLPVIGLVKKIDFFIDDTPFDLKVTYFPDGFIKKKRDEWGVGTELSELKRIAKSNDISFISGQKDKKLFAELMTILSESHLQSVKNAMSEFYDTRKKIIKDTMQNKQELIKWLYEEQGERRFDSANRLFLVLIEENNLEDSWKIKRNIDFLREYIGQYLDDFTLNDSNKVEFDWKNKTYAAVSDILFILKK